MISCLYCEKIDRCIKGYCEKTKQEKIRYELSKKIKQTKKEK